MSEQEDRYVTVRCIFRDTSGYRGVAFGSASARRYDDDDAGQHIHRAKFRAMQQANLHWSYDDVVPEVSYRILMPGGGLYWGEESEPELPAPTLWARLRIQRALNHTLYLEKEDTLRSVFRDFQDCSHELNEEFRYSEHKRLDSEPVLWTIQKAARLLVRALQSDPDFKAGEEVEA